MKPGVVLSVAPWGASMEEFLQAGREAERAGAATVWVPELHRSATVTAAALAQATSTVKIGTAIMLAFVRSPFVAALEAMDVDELSGGRLILGLGTGVRRLNEKWHNVDFGRPVEHLSEVIAALRCVIAKSHLGVDLAVSGSYSPLDVTGYRRPFPPVREAIPLYLAAVGPRITQLAGEIADGWISHELTSASYITEDVLPNIAEGLRRGQRDRNSVEIVGSACCAIDDDPQRAKRWAAATIAFYASVRTYEPLFDRHGFLAEARAVQTAFRSGDEKAMVDAVTDDMVEALACAGTEDEVRSRLCSFDKAVDSLKLSPPTHGVAEDVTRQCQERLLAMIGSLDLPLKATPAMEAKSSR